MRQRLITGIVASVGFFGLLLAGGWFYAGFLAVLALIGFREFVKLNGQSRTRPDVLLGFAAVGLIALPRLTDDWTLPPFETIVWAAMFVLLAATVFSKNRIQLEHASVLLLGIVYIGTGFHYMALTRELDNGILWSALAFLCIWASDSGAYFFGRAFGRTKLWPAISPNKTVEGALGGLATAIATGLVFAAVRPDLVGFGQAALIGLAAGVAGQLGDLVQSAYKRFRGVKDSGNLLPGHGGVLDRTDSWLIVFPLLHLLKLIP